MGNPLRPAEVPGCQRTCAEQSLFGKPKPHCKDHLFAHTEKLVDVQEPRAAFPSSYFIAL